MLKPVIVAGAVALTAICSFQGLTPRTPTVLAADQASAGPTQPARPMMADMNKMHEQMMAEQKAADARLDQLVAEMNAATGDTKVAALANVVTELVRQQKAMHAHMAMMGRHMSPGMGSQSPMKK